MAQKRPIKTTTAKAANTDVLPKDKLLPKLSLFFFKRLWLSALLWVLVVTFGILSYTTFLKREGFPAINIPLVIVQGTYAVNDPAKVDSTLAGPVTDVIMKQKGVSSVQTMSEGNFFTAVVQYDQSVNTKSAKADLEKAVNDKVEVPKGAKVEYNAPYFGVTGGDTKQIDAAISLYSDDNSASTKQLVAKAGEVASYLNGQHLSQVKSAFVHDPFENATNPLTGQTVEIQRSFDKYGSRTGGKVDFHRSVLVNITGSGELDVIKLDKQLTDALKTMEAKPQFKGYSTAISASNGPQIRESITELQQVLLEGLFAVLIIGTIVIAFRASVITVVSMVSVIAATVALLLVIGYTLNVITLFAIILGLSLIVDDTIIMVEALDASRKREKTATAVVRTATRKISRAMVAATLTAALSFTPLLFVGGILGTFIRAIPVTIISALLISLITALIFIPLFARVLLLRKHQLGEKGKVREFAAGFEAKIARGIARPMQWAQHHRKREFTVGISAVLIGVIFIAAAGFIFSKVTFNIFPPTKDANQLAVTLTYPTGTTVEQAETVANRADTITTKVLGPNFVSGSYYGAANAQSAALYLNLTPYTERSVTSVQLVDKLNDAFKDFEGANVKAAQVDVGPPAGGFTVNVVAHDRAKAEKLAGDLAKYLNGHQLKRPSGEIATMKDAKVANFDVFTRSDGEPVLGVTADLGGDDTTTLTTLAQNDVKKEFDGKKLASYGLGKDAISFNIGEEQDNQDSFKTLALAFPIVLAVIFLLLAIQFRSLLQPLLIFMAIPFSLFGVTLGLYLTDNAFSFFGMLGFFALIGLSIKNTILLTDYANQSRRAGMSPIDAAAAALGERFRPLVATSLTAICSLIPLAVTSPFWQGLAVVLIFGLASSTLLVVTIFPYYYLGAEYLRWRISRRGFFKWLLANIVVVAGLNAVTKHAAVALIGFLVLNIAWVVIKKMRK
jgi:multidrug efflux pump subunit AcrB